MVKVPVVDRELCTGCRTCEALCPQVFKLVEDKSTVICEDAADSYPAGAITFATPEMQWK